MTGGFTKFSTELRAAAGEHATVDRTAKIDGHAGGCPPKPAISSARLGRRGSPAADRRAEQPDRFGRSVDLFLRTSSALPSSNAGRNALPMT